MANQSQREPVALELSEPFVPQARNALTALLCELVAWPETRIAVHERQLAADILLEMLRTSGVELRRRCADGLIRVNDAPKALLRYLARDEILVAERLIENGVGFDDSDLIATIRSGVTAHWLAITRRRALSEPVTDALLQTGDVAVFEAVLRNKGAHFSTQGVDIIVARSRQAPTLPPLLAPRRELRPSQALTLFWWCGFELRMQLMRRFAVERTVLIEQLEDVFKLAAAEGWSDADARKALQVVERRQRNRAAATQSPYGSLEGAVAAAERGLDAALMREIAHLAGVKPQTANQIFADAGGEALGVFCKAVGLKRAHLTALWRAMRRPPGDPETIDNGLGRAVHVFDTLATAKAQTVLRYWNWSFTADSIGIEHTRFEDIEEGSSVARRNAALLFHRNV